MAGHAAGLVPPRHLHRNPDVSLRGGSRPTSKRKQGEELAFWLSGIHTSDKTLDMVAGNGDLKRSSVCVRERGTSVLLSCIYTIEKMVDIVAGSMGPRYVFQFLFCEKLQNF